MKVKDATVDEGARIRVTKVAYSESEARGHVDDAYRLLGATGTVAASVRNTGQSYAQLAVGWDDERPGTLMLAGEDEFEVIE